MSYELLRSLYMGRAAIAEGLSALDVGRLHIETPLEARVPGWLREGKDVVLTGNPGDGKTHVAAWLEAKQLVGEAVVERDLSAADNGDVIRRWRAAAEARRPYLLCANESPLLELLEVAAADPVIASRARELRGQVGRLLSARADALAQQPKAAVLVDLADRNLLDEKTVARAIAKVCQREFLPAGAQGLQTSAALNILRLQRPEVRARLARLLCIAGRRRGGHFTFRQLWQAIAFALTGGRSEESLQQEVARGVVGEGTWPVDHLVRPRAEGDLIAAVRRFADPALATDPALDERIWAHGLQGLGFTDEHSPLDVPAVVEQREGTKEALKVHARLKRYVALFHAEGDAILARLEGLRHLPSALSERDLQQRVVEGIRRLYLARGDEEGAPQWIASGVPLWVGHGFAVKRSEARPHVATAARPTAEFQVLRPRRVEWLEEVLGPTPEVAWLRHEPSEALLRITPDLLGAMEHATRSAGPMPLPEEVARFLARVAGWEEQDPSLTAGKARFVVLAAPRAPVVAHAEVASTAEGASYV